MFYEWRPYVPVAQRKAKARNHAERLAKQRGTPVSPIALQGRKIATTFWGQSWCSNLESYSDFANRLPRGRTYVRNGSIVDLQFVDGSITALVAGSKVYHVKIRIKKLARSTWQRVQKDCAGSIESMMDLLQGRFSTAVMQRLSRQKDGLFPRPSEIDLDCSCPDWADMCKHVAAVLYGVGARLDDEPQMLFALRGVDPMALIAAATSHAAMDEATRAGASSLQGEDLSELFGIEVEAAVETATSRIATKEGSRSKGARKTIPDKQPATAIVVTSQRSAQSSARAVDAKVARTRSPAGTSGKPKSLKMSTAKRKKVSLKVVPKKRSPKKKK